VAEAKRCLNCAICSECMSACGPADPAPCCTRARQRDDLSVGAVVLATGYDAYTRAAKASMATAAIPTCLGHWSTSVSLASGPTTGEIVRPSDGAIPSASPSSSASAHATRSTLLLQRMLHVRRQRTMLTIDHAPDARPSLPHGHARHGQGLRRFLQRSLDMGVKYIRSRPRRSKRIRSPGTS